MLRVNAEQVKKANDQRIELEKEIKRYKRELMIHEGLLDNEKKTSCKVYGYKPFEWIRSLR